MMKNTNRILIFVLMMITWVLMALPVKSQKLYKKDLKYYFELEGEAVKISEKEFKLLMEENENALKTYVESRKLSSLGSLGISISIPLVLVGLARGSEGSSTGVGLPTESQKGGKVLATGGFLILISSIICKAVSNDRFKKSVNLYNQSNGYSKLDQKWNMKFQIQPAGVGLICSF